MKKAIFAFVSMLGLATADTTVWDVVYESSGSISINRGNQGVQLESEALLQALDGCFIYKVGSDTSPAVGKLDLTFTLTSTTLTTTLVAFGSNSAQANAAGWGVIIDNGSLYLGQMNVNPNNTTSDLPSSARTSVGTVSTGTDYTLSIISTASVTGGASNTVSPGRGIDNFIVSLSDGETTTTTTVAGFGLNGDTLSHIYVGGSQSTSNTGTIGTVSSLTLSVPGAAVPEPATATLSLLALAGLAARRRRQ